MGIKPRKKIFRKKGGVDLLYEGTVTDDNNVFAHKQESAKVKAHKKILRLVMEVLLDEERFQQLSPTEKIVYRLFCEGKSYKEIYEIHGIEPGVARVSKYIAENKIKRIAELISNARQRMGGRDGK